MTLAADFGIEIGLSLALFLFDCPHSTRPDTGAANTNETTSAPRVNPGVLPFVDTRGGWCGRQFRQLFMSVTENLRKIRFSVRKAGNVRAVPLCFKEQC